MAGQGRILKFNLFFFVKDWPARRTSLFFFFSFLFFSLGATAGFVWSGRLDLTI